MEYTKETLIAFKKKQDNKPDKRPDDGGAGGFGGFGVSEVCCWYLLIIIIKLSKVFDCLNMWTDDKLNSIYEMLQPVFPCVGFLIMLTQRAAIFVSYIWSFTLFFVQSKPAPSTGRDRTFSNVSILSGGRAKSSQSTKTDPHLTDTISETVEESYSALELQLQQREQIR